MRPVHVLLARSLNRKPKLAHDQEKGWAKEQTHGEHEKAGPRLRNAERMGRGYRERQMGSPRGGRSTGNSLPQNVLCPALACAFFSSSEKGS